jgi:hypothetical protein
VEWFRKDNRVVQESIAENIVKVVDLQVSGTEPLMIYNSGSDLKIAYNRGGPWFDIPEGYQYTWETKHPFNSEFYVTNVTAVTSTITFFIGGSMHGK